MAPDERRQEAGYWRTTFAGHAAQQAERARASLDDGAARRAAAYPRLYALYVACEELRALMRDAARARRPGDIDETTARADQQWRAVRALLERMALDAPPPPPDDKERV